MEPIQTKLDRIEQKLDMMLSKETSNQFPVDLSVITDKLSGLDQFPLMVERVNFISQHYDPINPEPTVQEKAQVALEALKSMQLQLAQQASNIPAPQAEWIDSNNPVRIFLSNQGIKQLLLSKKALIDFAFENDFTKQDVEVGAFVYMLYISETDKATLESVGVQIQQMA
jgi:hypothetical protein